MKNIKKHLFTALIIPLFAFSQQTSEKYKVGFKTLELTDKSREYKPNTDSNSKLHYRPVDLDIWYPSNDKAENPLLFKNLFGLLEERAIKYQDNGDYNGITNELAQFYVSELGLESGSEKLLNIPTNSYSNLTETKTKHPVIFYMSGLNGMGFENYKVIENLVQNGYIVISIWSVGRYPGNMTNKKEDMMEQVLDAKFAIDYFKKNSSNIDFYKVGVLGCSWGGLSASVLINEVPNIKTMVSLDGTENHYFGESETDDNDILKIHDSELLKPEEQKIKYLYLESGDKLQDFNPSNEYNYFKQVNSEKFYLRFKDAKHSDFLCIPSILNSSDKSVKIYDQISSLTLLWFNKSIRKDKSFETNWRTIVQTSNITQEHYNLDNLNEEIVSEVSGVIIDKKTKEPLPYVNIGIVNQETGTVSDENGIFNLAIKESFKQDTIRVSMIGYKSKILFVRDLKPKLQLELEEELSELNEVVIYAKALKKKTLGNKTESKFLSHLFYYGELGKELGIKININKNPTYIDEFNFNISYNRFSARALFRLNMYTMKNGKPNKNILKDNIIIPVDAKQTGKVSVDLKEFDIIAKEDLLVCLEWIDTEGENNETEAIQISLGLLTGGTYERQSSQGKMKKVLKGMGLGYTLKVRQ